LTYKSPIREEFGHVVFETCEATDRHADSLIAILGTATCRRKQNLRLAWVCVKQVNY